MVSLTSVPGKTTEQRVLETSRKHVKDKMLINTGETRVECQVLELGALVQRHVCTGPSPPKGPGDYFGCNKSLIQGKLETAEIVKMEDSTFWQGGQIPECR